MNIIVHLKGGAGSGNFGHSGRPGLVGGSGEGTGTSGPPLVSTIKDLVRTTPYSGANCYTYFIMADNKLLDTNSESIGEDIRGEHADVLLAHPEWFGLDPNDMDFLGETAYLQLKKAEDVGAIRVSYSNYGKYNRISELNIETSVADTTTLRRLQQLYDQSKLFNATTVNWDGHNYSMSISMEEFLSAKYVTDGELKELVAILHIGY